MSPELSVSFFEVEKIERMNLKVQLLVFAFILVITLAKENTKSKKLQIGINYIFLLNVVLY